MQWTHSDQKWAGLQAHLRPTMAIASAAYALPPFALNCNCNRPMGSVLKMLKRVGLWFLQMDMAYTHTVEQLRPPPLEARGSNPLLSLFPLSLLLSPSPVPQPLQFLLHFKDYQLGIWWSAVNSPTAVGSRTNITYVGIQSNRLLSLLSKDGSQYLKINHQVCME